MPREGWELLVDREGFLLSRCFSSSFSHATTARRVGGDRLSRPDRPDAVEVTPRFKTFSYCRDQAIERMKAIQVKSGGDYECGFQCELGGDPHRMNVCKEIRK